MTMRLTNTTGILATLALTGFVLLPLAGRAYQDSVTSRKDSTISNAKQIAIGVMMYVQDYDEILPMVASTPSDMSGTDSLSQSLRKSWAAPIDPYIKNRRVFSSPGLSTHKYALQFMYNDLAASHSMAEIAAPANSILFVDGEDIPANVGHAWNKEAPPVGATIVTGYVTVVEGRKRLKLPIWRVAPGAGARLQTGPTRYAGSGIYAYLDGHVSVKAPTQVFFPPRNSNAPGSLPGEPRPGDGGISSFRIN